MDVVLIVIGIIVAFFLFGGVFRLFGKVLSLIITLGGMLLFIGLISYFLA